jgi:hypothetical protein
MTLRRTYAPMLPEFDAFLFATVGEEVDGMPLSVLSVLSRLDLDPRDEAARLACLTREAAADQLARMIARLSDRRWSVSEARRIAGELIERLPIAGAASKGDRDAGGTRPPHGSLGSSFSIYQVLVAAVIVTLTAGAYLFFAG